MSTSGGAGGGAIGAVTKHVAAAAIGTLFSAPTELVAAPGANRAHVVDGVTVEGVPGAHGSWALNGPFGVFYGPAPISSTRALLVTQAPLVLTSAAEPVGSEVSIGDDRTLAIWDTSAIEDAAVILGARSSNPEKTGGLTAIALANGGALYAPGDTGTIDVDYYVGGAAYVVDTVDGGGAVLTLHLTAAGLGYGDAITGQATTAGGAQPGIGTGLTVDAVSIVAPLGDLYVTLTYHTITTH